MDRERWPDEIAKFVDDVICPRCGIKKAEGILVTVRFQSPIWRIAADCLKCKAQYYWEHIDLAGSLQPKPQSTPLPAWVREL